MGGDDDHQKFDDFCGGVLDFGINFGRDGVFGSFVETEDDYTARVVEDARQVEEKKRVHQELMESGGGGGRTKRPRGCGSASSAYCGVLKGRGGARRATERVSSEP